MPQHTKAQPQRESNPGSPHRTRTQGRTLPLLLLGILFHLVFIYTVFDCYFTSPVVDVPRSWSFLPWNDTSLRAFAQSHQAHSNGEDVLGSSTKPEKQPLADRVVLIIGDGLRADLLLSLSSSIPSHIHPAPEIPIVPPPPSHPSHPTLPSSTEDTFAPYLRSTLLTRGAWGISHTRVPTESRPGHVALIAGMYEDVSAVTRGWKVNPVGFDSVVRSAGRIRGNGGEGQGEGGGVWGWGSPDILKMFEEHPSSQGQEGSESQNPRSTSNINMYTYSEESEDFSRDARELDYWVRDHLVAHFTNSTGQLTSEVEKQMRGGKVVYVLHLLGLDTTGHAFRPFSKEYIQNIQTVDSIVKEVEATIEEFYGHDGRTAYIFTADHGMSVVGNHGDGHPDNTRTPLITWGSGFRRPIPSQNHLANQHPTYPDLPTLPPTYLAPFNLTHLARSDVEQADVASLMSAVLGVEWSVNGVGVVPDVKIPYGRTSPLSSTIKDSEVLEREMYEDMAAGRLDLGQGFTREVNLAELALVNARVVCEQYRVKHEMKAQHTLFYKPFAPLSSLVSSVKDLLPSEWNDDLEAAALEIWKKYEGHSNMDVLLAYTEDLISTSLATFSSSSSPTTSNPSSSTTATPNPSLTLARYISYHLTLSALQGLRYVHTYDRTLLGFVVCAAYLGWAAFVGVWVLQSQGADLALNGDSALTRTKTRTTTKRILRATGAGILVLTWTLFAVQRKPATYFVYVVFPVLFWCEAAVRSLGLRLSPDSASAESCAGRWMRVGLIAVGVVGSLMAMVVAYTHRVIWSAGFLIIGVVWPLWVSFRPSAAHSASGATSEKKLNVLLYWSASCLVTSAFPMLSLEREESLGTVLLGGTTMVLCGWVGMRWILGSVDASSPIALTQAQSNGCTASTTMTPSPERSDPEIPATEDAHAVEEWKKSVKRRFHSQLLSIIYVMSITYLTSSSLKRGDGLTGWLQLAGWGAFVPVLRPLIGGYTFSLPTSPLIPPQAQIQVKLLTIFLALAPTFVILSISSEGFFYVAYCACLGMWVEVECVVRESSRKMVRTAASVRGSTVVGGAEQSVVGDEGYVFQWDDLRTALFFLFFVQVGFFGIGNVASISSFYLEPVFRLVVVFSPFLMATLLIFKIVIPYVMLSACFATLNARLGMPPFSLFLVSLGITDVMTLTFFFNVTDTGSWLEIGQSITFFCIASLLLVWSAGICVGGDVLMGGALRGVRTQIPRGEGEKEE